MQYFYLLALEILFTIGGGRIQTEERQKDFCSSWVLVRERAERKESGHLIVPPHFHPTP
jgi:hypothetical protein